VADAELLFAALDAIADHDPGEALRVAARLSESGRDPALFFGDLESHARELLVVQTLGDVPRELSVTPDRDERLLAQAERLDRDAATRLLDLLAVGLEAMKNGADARTQLELALVKGAAPDVDASTRALLARLDRLERQLAGGDAEVVVEKAPSPAPPPVPKAGGAAAAAAAAPAPTVAVAEQPAGELGSVVELWPAVMETIRSENDLLAAALEQGRPTPTGDGLVIGFPASAAFFKRQAEKEERRAALTQAIREVTGQRVTVTFELRDDVVPEDRTMSAEELVERFKDEFDAEEIFEEEEV
jgi:DNA polymerase-3 subunit gamma/tau